MPRGLCATETGVEGRRLVDAGGGRGCWVPWPRSCGRAPAAFTHTPVPLPKCSRALSLPLDGGVHRLGYWTVSAVQAVPGIRRSPLCEPSRVEGTAKVRPPHPSSIPLTGSLSREESPPSERHGQAWRGPLGVACLPPKPAQGPGIGSPCANGPNLPIACHVSAPALLSRPFRSAAATLQCIPRASFLPSGRRRILTCGVPAQKRGRAPQTPSCTQHLKCRTPSALTLWTAAHALLTSRSTPPRSPRVFHRSRVLLVWQTLNTLIEHTCGRPGRHVSECTRTGCEGPNGRGEGDNREQGRECTAIVLL